MRVRAPGSSANLGPGFDVLGLAVARYVWADDEGRGEPCGPDHIARIAYREAGGTGEVWFSFELEPGRGLGFSAAARAAGAALAFHQQGMSGDEAREAAYRVVLDLEGHGDNAAPAAFGGMWIIAGETHHRVGPGLPGNLLFWVPDLVTPTDASRAVLPAMIDRSDVVFNLGRVALLIAAAYEGRLDLLGQATGDRLHQPHRLAACEAAAKAHQAALSAGAAAAWLSGSGPTVAAAVADSDLDAVEAALAETGAVLRPGIDDEGATVVG